MSSSKKKGSSKPNQQSNKQRKAGMAKGQPSLETLKRLSELDSFIDYEQSSSELVSLNEDDENTSIEIQSLKKRMNKLNLNHTANSSTSGGGGLLRTPVQQSHFMMNSPLLGSAPIDHHSPLIAQHLQQTGISSSVSSFSSPNSFHQQPNKSRLPSYVANGQSLGYKQPSLNYQAHQASSTTSYRSDSRLSNSSIVPSEVSSMHNSHLISSSCSGKKAVNHNARQFSAPNSLLATPSSSSSPATPSSIVPSDNGRSSKQMKKSESESFNSKDIKYFKSKSNSAAPFTSGPSGLSKASSLKKANLNNKAFRFEEYMPLCKVQNMLGKGQIVEGVLRINQRNFEDAYISAPVEGEIDIRIYGKKFINRAFNNDLVAVQIRPVNDWNIMYNVIQSNWNEWKDEIIDVLQAKRATLENKLNDQCLDGEHINFEDSINLASNLNASSAAIEEEPADFDDDDPEDDAYQIDSDAYESAQEDFDDRIYLTEEFFPDDKQFDLCAAIENKVSIFSSGDKTAKVVTQRSLYNLDGVNLQSLKPEDLIRCSFYKRCLLQTGKVVHILRSASNKTCGGRLRLQSLKSDFVVFETTDKRIPNFLVPLNECPNDFYFNPHFYQNSLFIGQIRKWPATSRYPFGRLVKMIGCAGEIEAETEVLLVENNVDISDFPDNIETGLPITPGKETYDIPAKEIKKRRDMRDECVFTIDPATARDLDDALSIKKLSKHSVPGKEIYEVGVHIADVSYFVKDNLPIDHVAKQRTTSIYCVQKVIPMLPRILCEKYCSLNPGEDKLTFSVFWHMNANGEIVKEWFERTVIKSCIKLSYEMAADMIEHPGADWNAASESLPQLHNARYTHNDVAAAVNLMKEIAVNLRKKRFKHGSLEITKPEIRFVLDESRYNVLGFTTNKPKSTFLVEEFMLLANISVAKKIYTKFPNKSFLRRHPMPERKMIQDFEDLCKNAALDMDISSSKQLQSSLDEIKKRVDEDAYNFLSLKLLKTLRPAEYFSTMKINNYNAFQHYALCVPIYTHFTSPIRRYPDIIVHRLLAAALNLEKEPKFKASEMDEITTRCNDMKLANRIVGETSQKLFLSMYILSIGSIVQNAIVMQVFDQAFDCFLTKLNVTLRIYCNQLDLDHVEHNHLNDSLKLFYKNNPQHYVLIKILTKVNLKITVPDKTQILKWHAILV